MGGLTEIEIELDEAENTADSSMVPSGAELLDPDIREVVEKSLQQVAYAEPTCTLPSFSRPSHLCKPSSLSTPLLLLFDISLLPCCVAALKIPQLACSEALPPQATVTGLAAHCSTYQLPLARRHELSPYP
eukprot:782365-Pleurochrysis_carterae.AAC.2